MRTINTVSDPLGWVSANLPTLISAVRINRPRPFAHNTAQRVPLWSLGPTQAHHIAAASPLTGAGPQRLMWPEIRAPMRATGS